jgi:DNA-binding IscR family transcriptional regulator
VLAYHDGEALTSEALARTVNTNAVVIRRLLLDLRAGGLVETQRGPGGGARLARAARDISLAQIHHAAVGPFRLFGEHPNEPAQCCPVGRNIKDVLEGLSQSAARAVEREYEALSLEDLLTRIHKPDAPDCIPCDGDDFEAALDAAIAKQPASAKQATSN